MVMKWTDLAIGNGIVSGIVAGQPGKK